MFARLIENPRYPRANEEYFRGVGGGGLEYWSAETGIGDEAVEALKTHGLPAIVPILRGVLRACRSRYVEPQRYGRIDDLSTRRFFTPRFNIPLVDNEHQSTQLELITSGLFPHLSRARVLRHVIEPGLNHPMEEAVYEGQEIHRGGRGDSPSMRMSFRPGDYVQLGADKPHLRPYYEDGLIAIVAAQAELGSKPVGRP